MKLVYALLLSFICYGVVGFFDIFVGENMNFIEEKKHSLYDIVHANTDIYMSIPMLFNILAVIVVLFLIRWFVFDKKVLILYFLLMATLYLLRLMTYTVTQTPPPEAVRQHSCQRTFFKHTIGFSVGDVNKMCMDNMFSGHVATVVIMFLLTLKFSKSVVEKIVVGGVMMSITFFAVTSRIHYTSDVVIAIIISVLLFLVFPIKWILKRVD